MLIAVPVAIGVALFLTQYAPKRLASPAAALVDLLAAVPSIIYGLWGLQVLGPYVLDVQDWLVDGARLDPAVLVGHHDHSAGTIFLASIVLAIMILPIVTALTREVFAQTPIDAQGGRARPRRHPLGDDPDRRPAVRQARASISAAMLGLGRALGETIAVTIIVSSLAAGDVVVVDLQRRRDLRLPDRQQRGRVRQPDRRPAPSSPPAWCCSSSPSSSTRSPASSSSAGRRSPNEHP